MAVSAIGSSTSAPVSAAGAGLGRLSSDDFLRILVTEMRNQDPFEPTKTADMISSVSQIRSIELSGRLTDTLDLMTRQQRVSGASELIGKYIQAISTAADGTPTLHEGVVTGVQFDAGGAVLLELDTGELVPAADVVRVTTLEDAGSATGTEGSAPESSEKAGGTERRRGAGRPRFSLDGLLRL